MITNEAYMEISVLRKRGGSLREISVETGLAVNTVRRYLKTRPPTQCVVLARASKLDGYGGYLRQRIEAARPDWIPATVLLREITRLDYEGSLRILQVHLKALRPAARPDPVVRFATAAGEQMQLDWIEFRKPRNKESMLTAFVATLGFSRASYVEFVPDMRLETLLLCHRCAFDAFGGVAREILYEYVPGNIVVDATTGYAAKRGKAASGRVKAHVMPLTRVGHQPERTAGAALHVPDLHP